MPETLGSNEPVRHTKPEPTNMKILNRITAWMLFVVGTTLYLLGQALEWLGSFVLFVTECLYDMAHACGDAAFQYRRQCERALGWAIDKSNDWRVIIVWCIIAVIIILWGLFYGRVI